MKNNSFIIVGVIILSLSLSGCIPLNSVYRKPLEISPILSKSSLPPDSTLLSFEQTIKGIPLNETVWSNISTAYCDTLESNRIGFTQYRNFSALPLIPIATLVTYKVNSEIIVPFGNIYCRTFISAFERSHQYPLLAFTSQDETEIVASKHPRFIIKTKIDSFYVWEAPLNHLNLYAIGNSMVLDSTGRIIRGYPFKKESLNNKLGGIMSTSNTFLNAMQAVSNKFAQDIILGFLLTISEINK